MGAAIAGTLAVIAVLILLNAFFSLAETALTAVSRARMMALEKDGDQLAKRVIRLTDDPERMIGAVLLGSNVVTIAASAVAATLFTGLYGGVGAAIATAVLTPVLLIFGEVGPKTYAISSADKIARFVAIPTEWLVRILSPIVSFVRWFVNRVLRLLGVRVDSSVNVLAVREEIRGAIALHHEEGGVGKHDVHRIAGVLDLHELTVLDVMIHRKNVRTINADLPPREIVAQVLGTPYTRLPIWKDDPENIIGVLHVKEVLGAISASGGNIDQLKVEEIARKPWFAPETTNLQEQLNAFLRRREHFALVVDEYGALMGLVTLEDILEEIVGDIKDEHDIAFQGVRQQPDGSVNVDGWVPIRDLNRAMDWELPDEEAVTVAGLVIHEAQAIPEPGQRFSFHGYQFEVLRRNRNQITALRVRAPEPAADDE
jgi:Mg2+/Co2+ transporter CorB